MVFHEVAVSIVLFGLFSKLSDRSKLYKRLRPGVSGANHSPRRLHHSQDLSIMSKVLSSPPLICLRFRGPFLTCSTIAGESIAQQTFLASISPTVTRDVGGEDLLSGSNVADGVHSEVACCSQSHLFQFVFGIRCWVNAHQWMD